MIKGVSKSGRPASSEVSIGYRHLPLDTLIAAHGLSRDLIVVTNNTREFERVEGLRVENWL